MKKVLLAVAVLGVTLTVSLPGALARPYGGTTTQAVPGITSRAITVHDGYTRIPAIRPMRHA